MGNPSEEEPTSPLEEDADLQQHPALEEHLELAAIGPPQPEEENEPVEDLPTSYRPDGAVRNDPGDGNGPLPSGWDFCDTGTSLIFFTGSEVDEEDYDQEEEEEAREEGEKKEYDDEEEGIDIEESSSGYLTRADYISTLWQHTVSDYSCLQLTMDKDIFPAISGIAQQQQRARGSNYLAGLWEDTLTTDLMWHTPAGIDFPWTPR